MNDFPKLRQFLRIFAIDIGLSRDAAIRVLLDSVSDPECRIAFQEELRRAFLSSDIRWTELLFNDEYEVEEMDTEHEARDWAKRHLWNPVFGSQSMPPEVESEIPN
jgi:hypothetical protein